MKFKQKEGTIIDQLSVFDELKSPYEWSDEELAELYILGNNRKFFDHGETVPDSPCVVNGTYILVENMKQFEIMEPDIVDIAFIGDDGKGYVVYYDFKTQLMASPYKEYEIYSNGLEARLTVFYLKSISMLQK